VIFKRTLISAVAFLGLGMGAGTAQAAGSITGSISLIGFFDCACFAPGDTAIVSDLMEIVSLDPATSGAGFGDYAGSGGPISPVETILLDPLAPGFPGVQPVYTLRTALEFFAVDVLQIIPQAWRSSVSASPCSGAVCTDSLEFKLVGQVMRAGFDPTGTPSCGGRGRARASVRRACARASRRPRGRPACRRRRGFPSPRAWRSSVSAWSVWPFGAARPPDRRSVRLISC
jgi:hypothetical protein